MKKNITPLLLLAGAGVALYLYNKKQSGEAQKEDSESPTIEEKETADAVVTASSPAKVSEAVEQAREIASTVKDAVISVKNDVGETVAVVTSGEATTEKAKSRKLARQTKRSDRKASRTAKRTARRQARTEKRTARKQARTEKRQARRSRRRK